MRIISEYVSNFLSRISVLPVDVIKKVEICLHFSLAPDIEVLNSKTQLAPCGDALSAALLPEVLADLVHVGQDLNLTF